MEWLDTFSLTEATKQPKEAPMTSIIERAQQIEAISKTGMLPMDLEGASKKFPSVPAFRAALANSELDMAGLYAAKAIAFAKAGYKKEAKKSLGWAERSFSRYEWAKDAPGKEIYLYEVDWFQATRI